MRSLFDEMIPKPADTLGCFTNISPLLPRGERHVCCVWAWWNRDQQPANVAGGTDSLLMSPMKHDPFLTHFLDSLTAGDRLTARKLIREALDAGSTPARLMNELYFQAHERLESLFRVDQLPIASYNFATRLLRVLVDQTAAHLPFAAQNGTTVFAVCGPSQNEELSAQISVDLLEAAGCQVTFCGGGVPGDEVLAQVHERRPDVLLLFASAASDLPAIREIVDQIREIGASDRTRVIAGGGVFNRAEGLAEEIHCDLWAQTPLEMVSVVLTGRMKHQPRETGTLAKIGGRSRTTRRAAA